MYLYVQACVTIRLPVLLCKMYVSIRASMCHHMFTCIAVHDVCIYTCKHVSPYVYLYCCARCMYLCVQACVTIHLPVLLCMMYVCVQACVTICLPVLLCVMYLSIRASMCHHTFTCIAVHDVCIYACKHVSPYVYPYCCA